MEMEKLKMYMHFGWVLFYFWEWWLFSVYNRLGGFLLFCFYLSYKSAKWKNKSNEGMAKLKGF